jgi:DNA-binding MarR family transcriptional regulator
MTDDGAIWPAEREPVRDTTVVPAIHGAHHAMTVRLELSTREHGLEPVDALVLATLLASGGCPPWEIRRRIGLRPSTMTSVLDRLERAGRVTRSRIGFDRRRFDVQLTRSGGLAADLAAFSIAEVEAEIAGYTSPASRRAAVDLFDACVAICRRDRGSAHWR